jgi:hypothetical protein
LRQASSCSAASPQPRPPAGAVRPDAEHGFFSGKRLELENVINQQIRMYSPRDPGMLADAANAE